MALLTVQIMTTTVQKVGKKEKCEQFRFDSLNPNSGLHLLSFYLYIANSFFINVNISGFGDSNGGDLWKPEQFGERRRRKYFGQPRQPERPETMDDGGKPLHRRKRGKRR